MEQTIKFNLMEGMKFRFRQPHPLDMVLTIGPLMFLCPCCGGELWTAEELPGCMIAADCLELVQNTSEEPEPEDE